MKTNRFFLCLAAAMMLAACAKDTLPENDQTTDETTQEPTTPEEPTEPEEPTGPSDGIKLMAYTEADEAPAAPEAKATVGLNTSGKPQTFWENGDKISVYEYSTSADSRSNYLFETSLETNSTSAEFVYNGEAEFPSSDAYIAIYPHYESDRVVNFTVQPISTDDTRDAYRMAMVQLPITQTLVENGFDRSAAIATAYTTNLNDVKFKNAVALVKFKVSDANVLNGAITAVGGEKLSGTFRADILVDGNEPVLTDYKKTTSSSSNFSTGSNTPMSTSAEYYVAVRPTELKEGFTVTLNGVVVRTFTSEQVSAFVRNKIYDLGTLSLPDTPKSLVFVFTDATAMAGWLLTSKPDGYGTGEGQLSLDTPIECPYTLNSETYTFHARNPLSATSLNYPYFSGSNLMIPKYRFLGLPAIEGYKLTTVSFTHGSGADDADRVVGITSEVNAQSGKLDDGQVYVTGGESIPVTDNQKKVYTFNLTGTTAGTMYYIRVGQTTTAFNDLTLVYEEVAD